MNNEPFAMIHRKPLCSAVSLCRCGSSSWNFVS